MTTRDERPSLGNGATTSTTLAGSIRDRVDFAAALTELRERAAMTVRDVARACDIPVATLGGYFSGRHLPPLKQAEQLERVLIVLGVPDDALPGWREALSRARRGAVVQSQRGPYRGLEGYGVEDADLFVGREALVAAVCHRLTHGDGQRFVALVGVSGSGKSSLLRAGVAATLQRAGWEVCVLTPAPELEQTLAPAHLAAEEQTERPLLVAVDQLEEIFDPRVAAGQRDRFLEELVALADLQQPAGRSGSRPVAVAITLRADVYGPAMSHHHLVGQLSSGQVLVPAMTSEDLRRVIVEPAKRSGRSVEPELVDLILRDLGDRSSAGALPLLAHALVATWARVGKGALRVADYVAAGGVAGAVQRTAEEAYDRLDPAAQESARRLFAQLVHVDEEGVATGRRIRHEDVPGGDQMAFVLECFVACRILAVTEETVEIAHDVLLEAWPRLRQWIEDDRGRLVIRRRVSAAATAWEQDGRSQEALLRGLLLELATQLPDSGVDLTAAERDFVARSEQARQRHDAGRRRRRRLVSALAVVATVLAVVASTLAVHLSAAVRRADHERLEADQARREALSRNVALEATTTAATDPALAAQLAVAAYHAAPTLEARSAVLAMTGDPLATRLVGTPGVTQAVASRDGSLVAAAGAGGTVRIYARADSATPTAPRAISRAQVADGKDLFTAAFSPSHPTLAVAGVAGDVTLLDLSVPARPAVEAVLRGPTSAVQHLAFSADGTTLFAADSDSALYRWRLDGSTATPLPTTRGFGSAVQAVAASAQGLVATGSADGEVRLWREHGDRLQLARAFPVGPTTDAVKSVAFSPDGRLLAAGAIDEHVRVWRIASDAAPRLVTTLGGFTSWVNAVAFSPDGTSLAAGASGALAQVWRTSDWQLTATVPGPVNYTSIAFVPGTDLLLTGGIDGVARLRPLGGPRLTDFGDLIGASAQSADGSQLWMAPGSANPVVAQVRRTAALRYRETGLVLRAPAGAGTIDQVVAVSPDGSEVVAGTGAGKLVVWKVENGRARLVGVETAATALIEQVAFSPDGRFFGSVADDGTVSIYPGGTDAAPSRAARLDGSGMDLQLAFGPGDLLAVASAAGVVHLWHLTGATWTPLPDLKGFPSYVYGVAFSPDGRTFAAGGADKLVRIYRIGADHRFTLTDTVVGPGNTVHWLDFGDGGDLLAGASQDGKVWLWRVAGGKASTYAAIGNLGGQAYTVHLSPAAHEVFATGASGLVDGWSTDVASAARSICATAGSPLSRAEWAQYVPGASYAPPCR